MHGCAEGYSLQGVGGELAKGETEAERYGWYKLVYSLVEQQLQNKRWIPSPAILCCRLKSLQTVIHCKMQLMVLGK